MRTWFTSRKVRIILAAVLLLAVAIPFMCCMDEVEGIYIFRKESGGGYDIASDVLLGDERKVVWKLEFEPLFEFFSLDRLLHKHANDIHYEWCPKQGRGFVLYHLPQGRKFIMCFSRFRETNGQLPHGLFVGGGLPVSKHEDIEVTYNETGIAFYNGSEWHHVWCSVNEAVASLSDPGKSMPPSTWEFLGSRVLRKRDDSLALKSSHRVILDGQPVRIDRYAFFHAGTTFFTLVSKFTNLGSSPAGFIYVYGDEPWVGDYGTSAGNVGWTQGRMHYFESEVDTSRTSFAGYADYGNPYVPGETGRTRMANFLEWSPENRPDLVYFSNTIGLFAPEKMKVPLRSPNNRVIFLHWGPRTLPPGGSQVFPLHIGMAQTEPGGSMPVKPQTWLLPEDLSLMEEDQAAQR